MQTAHARSALAAFVVGGGVAACGGDTSTTSSGQADDGCWQNTAGGEFAPEVAAELAADTPDGAAAALLASAEEQLRATTDDDPGAYPGYALAVAEARVAAYSSLEPAAPRRFVGRNDDGAVIAEVVFERHDEGWLPGEQHWMLPQSVCDRLEERQADGWPETRGAGGCRTHARRIMSPLL